MATFQEQWQAAGEPVNLTLTPRLQLDDPDMVWYVERGKIDVFFTYGDAEDNRLNHLVRCPAQTLAMGFDTSGYEGKFAVIGLTAVGSIIRAVPKSFLQQQLAGPDGDQAAQMVNRWVEELSDAVNDAAPPRGHLKLPGDDAMMLSGKKVLLADAAPMWVKFGMGKGTYLNFGETITVVDTPFPITRNNWIKPSAQSMISFGDTQTTLKEDLKPIRSFHDHLLVILEDQYKKSIDAEVNRLIQRRDADERQAAQAMGHFAEVFGKTKSEKVDEDAAKDPYFSVADLVARGIHSRILPELRGKDLDKGRRLTYLTRESNIRRRLVVLTADWFKHDNGPMFAFVKEGHIPVALLPKTAKSYEMVDPVKGERTLVDQEIADGMEPYAYMFYRPLPEHPLSARDLLKTARPGLVRDILTVLLMGAAGGLMGLVIPFATRIIFDQVIPESASDDLVYLAAGLTAVGLSTALFSFTQGLALVRFEGKFDTFTQAALWDRLIGLPVPFFRNYSSGDLLNRAMGMETISSTLSGAVMVTLISSVFGLTYLIQLFLFNWKLALVGCGLVALAMIPLLLGILKVRIQRLEQEEAGRLTGMVQQLLLGIGKLRVSGSETRAFAGWARAFSKKVKLSHKAENINNMVQVWNATFSLLSMMTIFSFMFYLQSGDENISLGEFVAFVSAFSLLLTAMLTLSNTVVSLLTLIPVYERLTPILEATPERTLGLADPGELTGAFEVGGLSFRYSEDGPLILNDISLKVEPGEFVALIGPSGSGKSTLFRLLLGFEKPESGAVYFDDQDLSGVDISAVRRQIGVVLQNSKTVPGSIYDNIVGSLNMSQEQAMEAAAMAGFDQDIKEMPMGIHTVVSEGAGNLSGGQIQRLMIARALASKPRILFFDEATSALDNQTQATVTASLDRLHVTRVVIAHRLSTIINADKIFVIDRGKLVQTGTYEELIAQEGVFRNLAQRQLVEAE